MDDKKVFCIAFRKKYYGEKEFLNWLRKLKDANREYAIRDIWLHINGCSDWLDGGGLLGRLRQEDLKALANNLIEYYDQAKNTKS